MVGDVLVPRTQTRLRNKIIEELPLGVPICGVLGFGDSQVVRIWGQAILSLILLDLLLGTTQEKRAARVLQVKRDSLILEVSEGMEKIALPRPSMRSAEIRNNVNFQGATFASVVGGVGT